MSWRLILILCFFSESVRAFITSNHIQFATGIHTQSSLRLNRIKCSNRPIGSEDGTNNEVKPLPVDETFSDFEFISKPSTSNDVNNITTETLPNGRFNSIVVAILSSLLGVALFVLNQSQPPISGIALLKAMEADSPTLKVCNLNSRHTVITTSLTHIYM